jgi:hypothetical protein
LSNYTHELCKLAKRLDRKLELEYSSENHKYSVSINNVVMKEKYLRRNINGIGFTIEDACYDFIRKCRGCELENYMTDKIIEVI